jgi:DNA-binding GntR family transcriptional regulator
LFGENGAYKEGKKTPSNQIKEWLREKIKQRRLNVGNRLQISESAIKRIATLINPNPEGEAPKSNA